LPRLENLSSALLQSSASSYLSGPLDLFLKGPDGSFAVNQTVRQFATQFPFALNLFLLFVLAPLPSCVFATRGMLAPVGTIFAFLGVTAQAVALE